MRSLFLAATVVALASPVAVYAQAAKFSTTTSTIADLVANPEAKAVLEKHMPQIVGAASQIGTQTLKGLQSMAPDRITDKLLADIDADLAKIK
jgi:para-nitrobenzyl esterase